MSYLDSQFEEFLKEPLSGESADTSSSTKHETNMEELSPAPRNFWWMKERPQAEKLRAETGVSSDSSQMERGQASVSATMKNMDVAKTHVTVSPNLSSSMAEFIEKEKLCNELRSSVSEADSPAVGFEFQGDDVTDDDIGSIMEQLSQLAGSADDSATDKSVEEILKEAEDLVRETSYSFSGLSDSSNLLDLPITRRLDRSTAVGLTPESKTSKKTDKRFITEEKGKKAQSSLNRTSAVSASYRKMDVKSANLKMRDKGERLRGMSPRRTGSESGMEEFNGDNKFGDSRELAYSNRHDDIGARISEIKVGSVISDSKAEKHLGNVSGSTRKERDSSKKDRTVTFEDGLHLFPKPTDTVSKKHEDTVETSSKKLQQVESISNIKSDEISSENDALFALESSAMQQSTRDASSATEDKRVDRVTKEVSVSAPLIQHGDIVTTPEAIFRLIDGEARNEVVPALQEQEKNYSQDSDHSSLNIEKEMENIFGRDDSAGNTMADLRGDVGTLFHKKDQSAVVEDSNVSEPALHVDKLKDASTMTSLEELLQEQSTSSQLKAKLESEEQGHKRQLDALKCKHEEELFALKRDIYILNAKIADFEKQRESPLVQKGDGNRLINDVAAKEHRIALLETELQQQEQLMLGYQRENIKLCQDMKKLKEELKAKEQSFATERRQLSLARRGQEVERLAEQLKDKDETIVRLQIELQSLQDKNGSLERDAETLKLSITALQEEVEKHKCVTSKAVAPPLKMTPRNQELDQVKSELADKEAELEKVRKELQSTQKQMAEAKAKVTDSQLQVGALEMKVSELQAARTKQVAQIQMHNLRIEEDKKMIQDLNRQVKEMERILKRNHPNSISALILTANSEETDLPPRFRYLENRVQQLEQELTRSETNAQASIREIQDKFQAMKLKYEEHTSDLELQLATAKHQAHMWRQTAEKNEARLAAEKKAEEQPVRDARQSKKMTAPPVVISVGAPSANALAVREDAHLLATIRGLKLELAAKDKELVKIRRDLDESAKTNRKLQKERERQLGVITAPPRQPGVRGVAKEEELNETCNQSGSKVYDPTWFEPLPADPQECVKRLKKENSMLREELLRVEEDYRGLQTKRLQDLNLLQEHHEAEMDRLIADHMTRHSSSRIADLQGQLSTQQIVISHLKDQLKQLNEYRDEIEVLKAERDHLEKSNVDLRKKVANLECMQTPEMLQYEALREKLSELEHRHETREQKLRAVVRDLVRRNAEQRALGEEDRSAATMREKLIDKNRQLCSYRAEIDRILEALREFDRYKRPGSTVELLSD